MARQPRFILPGHPHHVIQRGNNKAVIFCSDEDYRFYLEKLVELSARFGCGIHAYVLMTNHVHLLVTPASEDSISKMMQSLGRYYVQYFNYMYKRTGTLWEGRYKATLIDSEHYLLTCMRYIELNPVRAGMVDDPGQYPWSSFRCNGMGVPDELITNHTLFSRLGRSAKQRHSAYRALFSVSMGDADLETIRKSTNTGWVLGNDKFKEEVSGLLDRRVEPCGRGGDRKSRLFKKINRL